MVCNGPLVRTGHYNIIWQSLNERLEPAQELCESMNTFCRKNGNKFHSARTELTAMLVWKFNDLLLHIKPHDRLAYAAFSCLCMPDLYGRRLYTRTHAHTESSERQSQE